MRPSNPAHYRARAFRLLAMPGWNYRRAMADHTRGRVIKAVARVLATDAWVAEKLNALKGQKP